MAEKKEDQAGGEGVAESKSPGVRAAVKRRVDQLNQPNNAAFKKGVVKLQEKALAKRKKRAAKRVKPKTKPPTKPVSVDPSKETTGDKLARRAGELDKLLKQQKGK